MSGFLADKMLRDDVVPIVGDSLHGDDDALRAATPPPLVRRPSRGRADAIHGAECRQQERVRSDDGDGIVAQRHDRHALVDAFLREGRRPYNVAQPLRAVRIAVWCTGGCRLILANGATPTCL